MEHSGLLGGCINRDGNPTSPIPCARIDLPLLLVADTLCQRQSGGIHMGSHNKEQGTAWCRIAGYICILEEIINILQPDSST